MSVPSNSILTSLTAHVDGELKYYVIGTNGVTDISEHPARGEGDRWFYDVGFEDGRTERCFEPNVVRFSPQDDDIDF